MTILARILLENLGHIKTCKPTSSSLNNIFTGNIPVVDLSDHTVAKTLIVNACKEFGFFKVINHGISMDLSNKLEAESVKFFKLPKQEKEKSGPPNPFGYGNRNIGPSGDTGLVEYLLMSVVNEYVLAVRNVACEVLEMIAEELHLQARDTLSSLIRDEKSDSCFRLNYYPPCPGLRALSNAQSLIGFGEHTDPQIISVLRSNEVSGFQICLKDGAWVSIPPDPTSFFLNVGDSLQVMTNGRFKSVRHRVLAADTLKSRVSMIYFGGPPLNEKITPLSSVMEEGEESLYKEYTWSDYKNSAYKTKLGDDRLTNFQKPFAQ
ncbi:hypothetical protein MIMGU_mgv1a022731mg [Erythranthe guttata]|uniref:Fe2OG dioxygenase domain-containing protein n=1 Tax=Erythranthe guttata TaxID=4155 RepID=A0A022R3F9_ERYGU|nr:hypothetical protein MIMGU_mgv1a022731mg [Erythranthe guttata]